MTTNPDPSEYLNKASFNNVNLKDWDFYTDKNSPGVRSLSIQRLAHLVRARARPFTSYESSSVQSAQEIAHSVHSGNHLFSILSRSSIRQAFTLDTCLVCSGLFLNSLTAVILGFANKRVISSPRLSTASLYQIPIHSRR